MFSGQYTEAGHWGLTEYGLALLIKWHRADPVSRKEIDRNNGIQTTQGNRNPFIDYPYLVEYIWGEHAGETLSLSKLMPSSDPDFIPGVSDGSRHDTVPPVEGIEEIEQLQMTNYKFFRSGQLLIRVNGHIYSITGQKVE